MKRAIPLLMLLLSSGCDNASSREPSAAPTFAANNQLELPVGYQECLSAGAAIPDKEKLLAQCRPEVDRFVASLRLSTAARQQLAEQIEGRGRRFALGDSLPAIVPGPETRPNLRIWAACAQQRIIEADDGVRDPKYLVPAVVKACHALYDGPADREGEIVEVFIQRGRAAGRRLPPLPPPPPPPLPAQSGRK